MPLLAPLRGAAILVIAAASLPSFANSALKPPARAASAPLQLAPSEPSAATMSSSAGGGTTIHSLVGSRIDGSRQVTAIGPDDLGDRVNLFNGRLSFRHVDVSLPGNNALPVAVARSRDAGRNPYVPGVLGDWDLEVPYIGGTYSMSRGWNTWSMNGARCSQFGAPPDESYIRGYWYSFEFWNGVHLHVGAGAGQEVLTRSPSNYWQPPRSPESPAHLPAWPLVTRDYWQIRCLPSIRNGAGEGFVARAPDGTEYRFDWMATRQVEPMRFANGEMLLRSEHRLFATRVTDRFGNFVDYHFDPADPWRLNRIEASDGRVLTLGYTWSGGGRRLSQVSDGVHAWSYTYDGNGDLWRVTLPDGTFWQFALRGLMNLYPHMVGEGGTCDWPGSAPGGTFEGTITHPSGLVGRFQAGFMAHARHGVPRFCIDKSPPSIPSEWTEEAVVYDGFPKWPRTAWSLTLFAKSLEGPGLHSDPGGDGRTDRSVWQFSYPVWDPGSWSGCTNCPTNKVVTVTDPRGSVTRYTYGTRFEVNEGQLLRKEEGWNSATGTALRVTENVYRATSPGPEPIGYSANIETPDLLQTRHRPLETTTITQQGTSFVTHVEAYEPFQARPVLVARSGSGGSPERRRTVYHDNLGLWVLNQVASVTDLATGLVVEANSYHGGSALKSESRRFGLLQESYEYRPDGTLLHLRDPVGRARTFNDWYRGVPRQVIYRDGASESAGVDHRGLVLWHVDRAGSRTDYRYDGVGRLTEVHYPPETWGGYHPTYLTLTRLTAPTEGVPAGYWLHEERTGNARVQRFLDPMWRLRMQRSFDAADTGNTASTVETRYDRGGLKLFESYPVRALGGLDSAATRGSRYWHDAVGREVARLSHTEVGDAVTATAYPAVAGELQKLVTNPRGHATRWRFRALGAPSYEDAVVIDLPESVRVDITRDSLGKPTALTRSGNYGGAPQSLTRRYVYDGHQRLCKTIEPENGATVRAYDAAGNVAWQASGQALPDAGQCNNDGAVPPAARVVNGYDAEDRLTSTAYGDGSPGVVREYWADGLLRRLSSGLTVWNYTYNRRRLLSDEELTWANANTYRFGHAIEAHGNRSALRYPDGYAYELHPNALGQPRFGGTYASQVRWHPNGALAGYVGSNGVSHDVEQHARGLPKRWRHFGSAGTVVDLQYGYDLVGNPATIADAVQPAASRTMQYDGLDRMWSASGVWGSGIYSYDALDNLRHSHVGNRAALATLDPGGTNRFSQLLVNGQTIGLVHDARGNVVQRGGLQFGFDIGNRLRWIGGQAEYHLDGHHRRVWTARTNGTGKLTVYDRGGRLLWSVDTATNVTTRHVYLGDKLIGETRGYYHHQWVHTDALGSPVARTNGAGQVIGGSALQYEPYGALVGGPAPDGIGFTGHVHDPGSGLVYMQQRYYDPVMGRFLSVDPVVANAQTGAMFGRYHYAYNNPYKHIDPDGRAPKSAAEPYGERVGGGGFVGVAGGGGSGGGGRVGSGGVGNGGQTITRYMGPVEAELAKKSGSIPNFGADGKPRPTHVTTDKPLNSASEAKTQYELPSTPTHSATVPANRVSDLGPTPDGRSTTSGGGSQAATNQLIPVKPDEIKKLGN
jgi:RHS repeat-associated protein